MKFYQRFAYYIFGFSIGLVFLFFILNGKETSCSYFPNARVLKDLRSKPFHYSDAAKEKLAQNWVDSVAIKNTLTYGDVDFSRSNIKEAGGKLYTIEGKNTKNENITVEVINYTDRVLLKDIKKQ